MVVFDLDATLWMPEMFELPAAPAPPLLSDGGLPAGGAVVRLLPGALAVLRELATDPRFAGVKVGAASSTERPAFADICLRHLEVYRKSSPANA